eukprot:GHVH01006440.1.p1 GENE.GHVH01006440.1~~GHVH01006440.1.p1  ORF type:complete len:212 (+),score=29.50 GHVH01006440.1:43-678(+)
MDSHLPHFRSRSVAPRSLLPTKATTSRDFSTGVFADSRVDSRHTSFSSASEVSTAMLCNTTSYGLVDSGPGINTAIQNRWQVDQKHNATGEMRKLGRDPEVGSSPLSQLMAENELLEENIRMLQGEVTSLQNDIDKYCSAIQESGNEHEENKGRLKKLISTCDYNLALSGDLGTTRTGKDGELVDFQFLNKIDENSTRLWNPWSTSWMLSN